MKTWPVIIGIVVILTFICSPALAISKSELISYHQGDRSPSHYEEFNYPLTLNKQDTAYKQQEITYDKGPSPSSGMTVAEWLMWGSTAGVPDSYYQMKGDLISEYAPPGIPSRGSVPARMCGDC
jgi:hypothetical protein